MTVPAVISGINAIVNNVSTMGTLKVQQHSSSKNAIYTSTGNGGAQRKCGNVDFTGFIHAFGYMPPTIDGNLVWPNSTFSFAATLAGYANDVISSTAFCTGIDVFWPVGEKIIERSYINYVIHFASAGAALAITSGTPSIADSSVPQMYCAQGMTLSIDGTPEPNVEWMEVSIRSTAEPYVNSTLNGIYSRAPGNFDWTFKYHRNVNSLALLPTVDSIHEILINVPSTTVLGASLTDPYWILKYGIFSQPITLTVARESPLPVTAEVEANMTGWKDTTAGGIWVPGSGTPIWTA